MKKKKQNEDINNSFWYSEYNLDLDKKESNRPNLNFSDHSLSDLKSPEKAEE